MCSKRSQHSGRRRLQTSERRSISKLACLSRAALLADHRSSRSLSSGRGQPLAFAQPVLQSCMTKHRRAGSRRPRYRGAKMNRIFKSVMLTASTTALAAAASFSIAQAQTATTAPPTETVEVTGTRINLAGFQSPTPVQVIGAEQIERNAQVQISDEIRDLPQVQGTVGSRSGTALVGQGSGGIDSLNIRGFGAVRNLVLFDHQRVVSSTIQDNVVDLGTIPSALV